MQESLAAKLLPFLPHLMRVNERVDSGDGVWGEVAGGTSESQGASPPIAHGE